MKITIANQNLSKDQLIATINKLYNYNVCDQIVLNNVIIIINYDNQALTVDDLGDSDDENIQIDEVNDMIELASLNIM